MAQVAEDASFERARNYIATLALSMYQIHGLPAPSPDVLGNVVRLAEASLSLDQLRHPEDIGASALGQIDQFVLNAAEAKKRPVNAYSADAARLAQGDGSGSKAVARAADVLDRMRNAPSNVRETSGEIVAERVGSGARFDDLNSMDWGSPAGMARMRELAVQKGVPWAANNPDLLRLGPAAIGALADVHFKQESYKRLTTDASFKAKEIVTLARFAKEHHIDANHLAGVMAHGVKTLAGDNVPERRKLDTAFSGYMEHPERPDAKKQLFKTLSPYADDPNKKPEVYKMLDAVKIRREEFDASRRADNANRHSADAKGGQAKDEAHRAAEKKGLASSKEIKAGAEVKKAGLEEKKAGVEEKKAGVEEKKAGAKIQTASIKTSHANEAAVKATASNAAKAQSKAALGAELG